MTTGFRESASNGAPSTLVPGETDVPDNAMASLFLSALEATTEPKSKGHESPEFHPSSNSPCAEYWDTPTTREECENINELFMKKFKNMYGIPPPYWLPFPRANHMEASKQSASTAAQSSFHLKLTSGAIAGILGTCLIFPLDLIKTRLQNQRGTSLYRTGWECGQFVFRMEGLRGFYRGLLPNLLGVTPEKAIKLAVNDTMRLFIAKKLGVQEQNLAAGWGMLAGATAGFSQVIATNPMEIVKIQMQVATTQSNGNHYIPNHEIELEVCVETPPGLMAIVRRLGLKGLYYGVTATLARDIPFSILFFSSFSSLKNYFRSIESGGQNSQSELSLSLIFFSGILSGIFAAFLATPMDVVKTRMQTKSDIPQTMATVYRHIWQREGLGAFFKGSVQRCCIISPLFGISLLAYEFQQRLFSPKSVFYFNQPTEK